VTQIEHLVEWLRAHKSVVIQWNAADIKARALGLDLDTCSVCSAIEEAGFSFLHGSADLIIKPDTDDEKTDCQN